MRKKNILKKPEVLKIAIITIIQAIIIATLKAMLMMKKTSI